MSGQTRAVSLQPRLEAVQARSLQASVARPVHGVQADLLPCRALLASATTIPKSSSLPRKTAGLERAALRGGGDRGPCMCPESQSSRETATGRLLGPPQPQSLPLGPYSSSQDPALRGNAPSLKTDRLAPQSGGSEERCFVRSPAVALQMVLLSRVGREAGPHQSLPAGQQAVAWELTSKPGPSSPG